MINKNKVIKILMKFFVVGDLLNDAVVFKAD